MELGPKGDMLACVQIYEGTEELFMEGLGGFLCSNQALIDDIVSQIGAWQAWCGRDPYALSPGQGLSAFPSQNR